MGILQKPNVRIKTLWTMLVVKHCTGRHLDVKQYFHDTHGSNYLMIQTIIQSRIFILSLYNAHDNKTIYFVTIHFLDLTF